MIERTDEDGISLFRMAHKPANVLTAEFSDTLWNDIKETREDPTVRAVVLSGTGSAFSAGVDLFRVIQDGPDYVDALLSSLSGLLDGLRKFPKPLVAAVNGHAIAGGAVVACACDYRVMVRGNGKIGLPELQVGLPFFSVALEIMRGIVPARYLREVLLLGRSFNPEDARERGLVNEIVDSGNLLPRALEIARRLATIPEATFALSKRQLSMSPDTMQDLDEELQAIWQAEESHAHIRAYLERTLGKSVSNDV